MAIYLGGERAAARPNLDDLTPRQIVEELDKYVVGQNAAKKAVAVALLIVFGGKSYRQRLLRTFCRRIF